MGFEKCSWYVSKLKRGLKLIVVDYVNDGEHFVRWLLNVEIFYDIEKFGYVLTGW